jgi:heme exporter protein D
MNPWGFIIAAYGVSAVVLLALIAWVVIDRRLVSQRLAVLEARGVRRRSAGAAPSSASP